MELLDNAVAESFSGSLKSEYRSRGEVHRAGGDVPLLEIRDTDERFLDGRREQWVQQILKAYR